MTAAREPRPLSELLRSPRTGDTLVCFEPGHARTWDDFLGSVAALAASLERAERGRWLLGCRSSYAFAVGLFALWDTWNVPVLLANLQPGSTAELHGESRRLISDLEPPEFPGLRLDPLAASAEPRQARALGRGELALEMLTSGSTGLPKRVRKTFGQLEDEIRVLEASFGARLAQSTIFATVSHQHIYGLLFRVLWPLCSGRAFVSRRILLWPELLATMAQYPLACLVGSPSHLDSIGCAPAGADPTVRCSAVFSSGGPLAVATADSVETRLGCRPIEVFGSTETGGLGWRVQTADPSSTLWTPLVGVKLSPARGNDRLEATSPFILTPGGEQRVLLDDLGRVFADGRFSIVGRADRIVKIAEKRLSLDEMERRLSEHPSVARAALVVLEQTDRLGRRATAAAVVFNAAGSAELRTSGPTALQGALRRHLGLYFEPVLLPRLFHFTEALPTDAQGKGTVSALARLFAAATP